MTTFLSLRQVVPRIQASPFRQPINWELNKGEIWTVNGPNGSGKSMLAKVLCGRYQLVSGEMIHHFPENLPGKKQNEEPVWPGRHIKIVSFNAVYSLSDFRESYYQQRFNSTENEWAPTVDELFHPEELKSATMEEMTAMLGMDKLMKRRLIQLSSGEMRKLIIAKALMDQPKLLILDNPFIGLDTNARQQLNELFPRLNANGIQLLFLAPSVHDVPACTTHLARLENGKLHIHSNVPEINQTPVPINWTHVPQRTPAAKSTGVIDMKEVDITYGDVVINKGITWKIQKGEKWALLGPNGSGKSTLLSYIFADHPQAYAKNLTLFGQKRGSGESIWDIKKRIGFTSSEMHLYYRQAVSCLKVVESGFFDSVGLYRKCSSEQKRTARYLFDVLQIAHLEERTFTRISAGEQRLVLFARSLVKNPELLILDEPFHGLDDTHKQSCLQLVESFCSQPGKSLIFVTHSRKEIPGCIENYMELNAQKEMISLRRTDSDNPDFIQLVNELDADLRVRDGEEHAFYAQFNKTDQIKHVVVAYRDGKPVGCGAVKPYDKMTMEIKRMFVLPELRGMGIASQVLKALEEWTEELGCENCILETGVKQPEAIALYTKNKYHRIPNYGPYKNAENSVCFYKQLTHHP